MQRSQQQAGISPAVRAGVFVRPSYILDAGGAAVLHPSQLFQHLVFQPAAADGAPVTGFAAHHQHGAERAGGRDALADDHGQGRTIAGLMAQDDVTQEGKMIDHGSPCLAGAGYIACEYTPESLSHPGANLLPSPVPGFP